MISPTMRSRTVISASHSGQCVMCCDPPSNSATSFKTNKNALRPSLSEGRRALKSALVVPPSFVDASRHQPRRVLTYSSPLTGASGQGLLSHNAISSRSSGFYSRLIDIRAFHQSLALCMQQGTATRPFKAFALFSCPCPCHSEPPLPVILSRHSLSF